MSSPDDGPISRRRMAPAAPVPALYTGLQNQYEDFLGRNAGFLAPGDADKIRAGIQQAANLGVDPGYLNQAFAGLKRAEDYKNTRIAQGFDSAAATTVTQNFGQQVDSFTRGLEGAQRVQAAGVPQNQVGGLLGDYATGSPTGNQALNELLARQAQLNQQNQQLADFRNRLGTQYFGDPNATLQQALTSTSGDIGQLNQFLGEQQSRTFQRDLAPLINMQMGARGLQDSGANIELQSKALGQLEQSRQQSLMQAALGARQQIAGLGREDILGDVGARQQSLTDAFGLQRAGITMQFQQQLEQQREQLARELSQRQGAASGGLGGILSGGLTGGLMGFMAGGPYGAALGAGIGAYGGSQSSGPLGGLQYGMAGGQAGGFFRNDARPQTPQPQPYRGPMNSSYSPWVMTGGY